MSITEDDMVALSKEFIFQIERQQKLGGQSTGMPLSELICEFNICNSQTLNRLGLVQLIMNNANPKLYLIDSYGIIRTYGNSSKSQIINKKIAMTGMFEIIEQLINYGNK